MAPTLQSGDRVLVRGIAGEAPSPGDVVIFEMPTPGQSFEAERVSRVVAVEGDRGATEDGRLLVNGEQVAEGYLPESTRTEDVEAITVPDGHVYVLSDNRGDAQDSRLLGPIPHGSIYARVSIRWWPLADFGGI